MLTWVRSSLVRPIRLVPVLAIVAGAIVAVAPVASPVRAEGPGSLVYKDASRNISTARHDGSLARQITTRSDLDTSDGTYLEYVSFDVRPSDGAVIAGVRTYNTAENSTSNTLMGFDPLGTDQVVPNTVWAWEKPNLSTNPLQMAVDWNSSLVAGMYNHQGSLGGSFEFRTKIVSSSSIVTLPDGLLYHPSLVQPRWLKSNSPAGSRLVGRDGNVIGTWAEVMPSGADTGAFDAQLVEFVDWSDWAVVPGLEFLANWEIRSFDLDPTGTRMALQLLRDDGRGFVALLSWVGDPSEQNWTLECLQDAGGLLDDGFTNVRFSRDASLLAWSGGTGAAAGVYVSPAPDPIGTTGDCVFDPELVVPGGSQAAWGGHQLGTVTPPPPGTPSAGSVAPTGQVCFTVAGTPGDVALVNLTPVGAAGAGNGQLIASGVTPPQASSVNFGPVTVDPNVAAAPIGADGKVCYANSRHTSVHVIADHLGTIAKSVYTLATPEGVPRRVLDTRTGAPVGPSARVCFAVAGAAGDVALVNVTPVLAAGPGNGQLMSSDVTSPPVASNVNFAVGTIDPNVAPAPIGFDGQVCFQNSRHNAVHLIADHLGTIARAAYTLADPGGAPRRVSDTRGAEQVAANTRVCFAVAGQPGDVALVNLTPVDAQGAGNGQLVSSSVIAPPLASNVNFGPGTVDPNVAAAPIGADGRVCFHNSQHTSVHLIADHLGTISASVYTLADPTGAPVRKVDTRT